MLDLELYRFQGSLWNLNKGLLPRWLHFGKTKTNVYRLAYKLLQPFTQHLNTLEGPNIDEIQCNSLQQLKGGFT